MASILRMGFEWLDDIEKLADPRVKNWFLMQSPIYPALIIVLYLYFVEKLGPELMKNRKPFQIDKLVVLYNAVQVILAAYLVEEACRVLWFKGSYDIRCIEIDYSEEATVHARTVWLYFMTKCLDLLDTVFFVLRKKQSQVTFLHVYHHTLVFVFAWFITKYYAGGHVAFFGTVNAFVHMIMYSYYLFASLQTGQSKTFWWKKYITQLQLVQFIVTGAHAMLALFASNCKFPKYLIALGIPQDIFMFIMFWDFYYKSYISKSKQMAQKTTTSGVACEIKSKDD